MLGGVLTGDVKIRLVRQRTPTDLKLHLTLTAREYGSDYQIFRSKIEEYWKARGPTTSNSPGAMQTDYVQKYDEKGAVRKGGGKGRLRSAQG